MTTTFERADPVADFKALGDTPIDRAIKAAGHVIGEMAANQPDDLERVAFAWNNRYRIARVAIIAALKSLQKESAQVNLRMLDELIKEAEHV